MACWWRSKKAKQSWFYHYLQTPSIKEKLFFGNIILHFKDFLLSFDIYKALVFVTDILSSSFH